MELFLFLTVNTDIMKPKVHEHQPERKFNCVRKLKLLFFFSLFSSIALSQVTRIEAKDGVHFVTTNINYPITGTYYFKGEEPVVELNAGGNGFYQLHEQPKRAMAWGIECDEAGTPIFKKGFDNAAYTLWYQYTSPSDADAEEELIWKPVSFTIHFNTQKMFIQGERSKTYSGEAERKP